MKRLIIATILALSMATAALAKDLHIVGCTKDHRAATLYVYVDDSAAPEISTGVITAFKATAHSLTAEALVGDEGFKVFISNLTEDEYGAIGLIGPPTIGGSCETNEV